LVLVIIIGMPIATPKEFRNSARSAFGDLENCIFCPHYVANLIHSEPVSDWPIGYGFILSFMAPLWTIGGFDACVHISEEASNATVAVPWAIVGAVTLSGVLGWGEIQRTIAAQNKNH
jgi:amino acid transporter